MTQTNHIAPNLEGVRERIAAHCKALGRALPRLVAVSKGHGPEAIIQAYELGQRDFGENYSQELSTKRAALPRALFPDARFSFIGRLQSNKIKAIVRDADEIQSLADLRHAHLIAKAAEDAGRTPYPVYYLVNAGDEPSKDGMPIAAVHEFHAHITNELPQLAPQGIMAIPPPLEGSSGNAPELYTRLRQLADHTGAGLLSLGMSDDLEAALAAGTDCLRIGTAIFGPRTYK